MESSGSDSAGIDAGMAEDATSTWETMKSAASMDFFSSRSFCSPAVFGPACKYTLASRLPQILPDFFGGENENRCDETDQGAGDFPDGGLRGAAGFASGRLGVEA